MQKKSSLVLIVFIFLFSLTFISAVPPFVQEEVFTEGYEIRYPLDGTLKLNLDHTFYFHVYNISNGMPISNSSTNCVFHLYDSSGEHILEVPAKHYESEIDNEWEVFVGGNNFSKIGDQSYLIQCNSSSLGGFASVGFGITLSGLILETSEALIYLILAFGVLLLFIISFYFMISIEYGNKINESGAVFKISKTKYVKLGLILLTWVLFTWFLNILIGLSNNFVSLTMYYGLFSFIFNVMNRLALPLGIFILILSFFEIIRDANIQKAISKFGSSK